MTFVALAAIWTPHSLVQNILSGSLIHHGFTVIAWSGSSLIGSPLDATPDLDSHSVNCALQRHFALLIYHFGIKDNLGFVYLLLLQ